MERSQVRLVVSKIGIHIGTNATNNGTTDTNYGTTVLTGRPFIIYGRTYINQGRMFFLSDSSVSADPADPAFRALFMPDWSSEIASETTPEQASEHILTIF